MVSRVLSLVAGAEDSLVGFMTLGHSSVVEVGAGAGVTVGAEAEAVAVVPSGFLATCDLLLWRLGSVELVEGIFMS